MNINICIAGLGRAGRFHLESIKNLPNCNLKYVIDPGLSPNDEIVKSNDFTLLKDSGPALSDNDVDALIISTPTRFHHRYICQALEAGKHVFTEKPLGKSVTEIKECYALARQKGLCLYLGFQRRYDRNFSILKSKIPQLGKVRTVKISSRDNPKPSLEYLKISGNIFHDMLIHDFDMLSFLFGDKIPSSVYATAFAYDPEIAKQNDYDNVLVTIKYDDGLMVAVDTSRTSAYGYDQRIELFAENGMAIAENQKNHTVTLYKENGVTSATNNFSFPQRYKEAYYSEIEDFVKGISEGARFNVSEQQCICSHLIADAAFESAKSGTAINFKLKYVNWLS